MTIYLRSPEPFYDGQRSVDDYFTHKDRYPTPFSAHAHFADLLEIDAFVFDLPNISEGYSALGPSEVGFLEPLSRHKPDMARQSVSESYGYLASNLIGRRMQDHIFQTEDGVLHMVLNLGANNHLVYLTSQNGGKHWKVSNTFTDANYASAPDVCLYGNGLKAATVYVNDQGRIVFSVSNWDDDSNTWHQGKHVELPAAYRKPL